MRDARRCYKDCDARKMRIEMFIECEHCERPNCEEEPLRLLMRCANPSSELRDSAYGPSAAVHGINSIRDRHW